MTKPEAFEILHAMKHQLDKQQYRTLCGQVNSGDVAGAMRGLEKIMGKNRQKAEGKERKENKNGKSN